MDNLQETSESAFLPSPLNLPKRPKKDSHITRRLFGSCLLYKYKTKATLALVIVSVLFIVLCIPPSCLGKVGGGGTGGSSDEKEDISSSAGVGESLEEPDDPEMAEYLDDEVRFVTEDDFDFEGERSNYRDFHQGTRSRISHQYERCPPLPDPSAVVADTGLCDVKKCQRDDECSKDGSVICCYNGCIYSCLPKVNPPLPFDWVEETDLKYDSKEHGRLLQDNGPSPRALLNAEISPETIAFPGGCYLSTKQYDDLVLFRKFDHVKACSCSKGEVFCEINHEDKISNG